MSTINHELSEEDRIKLGMQADYLIEILSHRYGVTPSQVVEAIRWVDERRTAGNRLRQGGSLTLLSLVVGALGVVLWEGLKSLIWRR